MKKRIFWLALAAALLLCACGKAAPDSAPEKEYRLVVSWELEALDAAGTERMIRVMNGNRALIADGALYSLDFDESLMPVLVRYALRVEGLCEWEVLAEDCVPEWLTELDGRLYYINGGNIECVRTDGKGRRTLREGNCSYLQVREGRLYFCDEAGRFCTAGLDGKGEEILINDRCFYPFLLRDAVLYQSHSDGERLHLYRIEDGDNTPITFEPGYAPVIAEGRLYYTGPDGLVSTGLDGFDEESVPVSGLLGAAELLPQEDGYGLRCLTDENGPRQWTASAEAPEERQYVAYSGYRLCDYVGDGYRVDAWYNPDGRIRCFVLSLPDGMETEYIAGRINGE